MEKKMINRNNRTIITNRTYCLCQQYVHMRIADDFFDRKWMEEFHGRR